MKGECLHNYAYGSDGYACDKCGRRLHHPELLGRQPELRVEDLQELADWLDKMEPGCASCKADAPLCSEGFCLKCVEMWDANTQATRAVAQAPANDESANGTQQQFATGAVRDTAGGKPRLDLLPWAELERVADHYERGMQKYAARNWEKGIPSSRCLQSLLRHVSSLAQGASDEDHAAAVVFNALAIMFNQRVFEDDPELNDLPGFAP